jgi:alkylhydroperoxidase/carboxymuconolactone decarboxylase family protein YurZ
MMISEQQLQTARTRLTERFATQAPPSVLSRLPAEVVRDACLNLTRALDGDSTILPRGDRLLIGVGVAMARRGRADQGLVAWLSEAAQRAGKKDEDLSAIAAVALAAATYAGYYKFRSMIADASDFHGFQPMLRATPFIRSSLSKSLVELTALAIAVMNGCTQCTGGHVQAIRFSDHPQPNTAVDEAVRISAVIAALADWDHA